MNRVLPLVSRHSLRKSRAARVLPRVTSSLSFSRSSPTMSFSATRYSTQVSKKETPMEKLIREKRSESLLGGGIQHHSHRFLLFSTQE